jgi:hypothetical protein
MAPTIDFHRRISDDVIKMLEGEASPARLNAALRLLCKHRSLLIQEQLIRRYGVVVQGGPFEGMLFNENAAEGCHIPKLLGCYEEELHGVIREIADGSYDVIVNIGCAEGYYAVGFKRLCPQSRVLAFDTNPAAQAACQALAHKNSVEVEIGGEFQAADFAAFKGKKVVVWCDIEGAEADLMDPLSAPLLAGMDAVVELHPTARGDPLELVPGRFDKSHEVQWVHGTAHVPRLPPFLMNAAHLDQLLSQWEWRGAPTPWVILKSRSARA